PARVVIIQEEDHSVPTLASALDSLADLGGLLQRADDFQPVLSALKQGRSATIDGAWGSSAGLAVAALSAQAPATLVVVLAHPGRPDAWAGGGAASPGRRPVPFPAWDNQPAAGQFDAVAAQRLRLLRQLDSPDAPPLVLTTIQALVQPVPERAQLA